MTAPFDALPLLEDIRAVPVLPKSLISFALVAILFFHIRFRVIIFNSFN